MNESCIALRHMQTLGERWELLYITTGNHGHCQGRASRAGATSGSVAAHAPQPPKKKKVGIHLIWVLTGETTCPSIPLSAECDAHTAQAPPPTCCHPQSQIFPLLPPSPWGSACPSQHSQESHRAHYGRPGKIKLGPTGSAI